MKSLMFAIACLLAVVPQVQAGTKTVRAQSLPTYESIHRSRKPVRLRTASILNLKLNGADIVSRARGLLTYLLIQTKSMQTMVVLE